MPAPVMQTSEKVIELHKEVSQHFPPQQLQKEEGCMHDGHKHFIEVLQEMLRILTP